jgi:hypothetical protein
MTKTPRSDFKNGILISALGCITVVVIFFLYAQSTSPNRGEIFLSHSLYNFAIVVLISFFVCIILIVFGLLRTFFINRVDETSRTKLAYYLQIPFRERKIQYVFLLSSIAYFIFFGFLTNMLILFNDDGTIFSLLPSFNSLVSANHNPSSHLGSSHQSGSLNPIESLQKGESDQQHAAHPQQQTFTFEDDESRESISLKENSNKISYPGYRITICCNNFGYVPMLTILINSNISLLLIPLNLFLGIIISLLVGLNISYNIFLIKRLKINHRNFSKRNFLSGLGISSGFLVGCPTCADSLLYTLIGFSSLVTFSSLSLYQTFFIVISIPALIISLLVIAKFSRKSLCEFPDLH